MKRLRDFLLLFTLLMVQPLIAQEKLPTFTLKENGAPTLHIKETGNGIIIKEYPGKIILLNFFGKRCIWCMREIPHLVELQKEYKDQLQVIALHAQEAMTLKERSALEQRLHFNYPIYEYVNNLDFTRYIATRANWKGGLPFSIIFDKQGNAAQIINGYTPKEELEKIIKFLMKQK
jgi:thiol-disulfide isomerase/thioredoxin